MNCCCALLIGVLAVGQAPVNDNLKVLEPLIGAWEGEVELVEDVPGVGETGDKLALALEYAWSPNGQALMTNLAVVRDGVPSPVASTQIMWCPNEKHLVGVSTGNVDRGVGKSKLTVDGDKLISGREGMTGDGIETASKSILSGLGKDTLVIRVSDRVKGDEERPDYQVTYRRIDRTSTREEFEEFCKLFEGRWIGEVKWVADWPDLGKKGDVATCYLDIDQVEDGNAMTGKFYGGAGSGTVLWVYDSGSKTISGLVVYSGGMVSQLKYFKDGDQWIETGSGTLPDGRKTQGRSTMTWDGNKLRLQGQGTIDGKPNDPRDDKWQRLHPS